MHLKRRSRCDMAHFVHRELAVSPRPELPEATSLFSLALQLILPAHHLQPLFCQPLRHLAIRHLRNFHLPPNWHGFANQPTGLVSAPGSRVRLDAPGAALRLAIPQSLVGEMAIRTHSACKGLKVWRSTHLGLKRWRPRAAAARHPLAAVYQHGIAVVSVVPLTPRQNLARGRVLRGGRVRGVNARAHRHTPPRMPLIRHISRWRGGACRPS